MFLGFCISNKKVVKNLLMNAGQFLQYCQESETKKYSQALSTVEIYMQLRSEIIC